MNIKDFLIDNYIWILAIILITIVTIIGFLADKKKGDKKKDKVTSPPQPIEPINNNQPQMQYQPTQEAQMNQEQNIAPNTLNQMPESMNQNNNNQNIGTIPQQIVPTPESQNIINTMNSPQPVENVVPNTQQEPMYQPLSEQKPNIPPQPVPNFDAIHNQNMQETTPTMNNIMPMGNNLNNANNQFTNPEPMMNNSQPVMQEQQHFAQPMQNNQENNNFAMPNMIPNQGTIPQPVNPIPVPQPVMPQPIMTNQMMPNGQIGQMPTTYNMNQPMQNNNFQNAQPMMMNNQQPVMQGQPQVPPQQPAINFVYGPQNNNQNM